MSMNFNIPKLNFESMGRINDTIRRIKNNDSISAMKNPKQIKNHRNPYTDQSMCITGKEHLKVEVAISEEMTQQIIDEVRECFRDRGGMSGTDYSDVEKKKQYIMNSPPEMRISVGYSIDQIRFKEAQRIADFIRSKDSSWDWNRPVKPEIYEQAIKAKSLDINV